MTPEDAREELREEYKWNFGRVDESYWDFEWEYLIPTRGIDKGANPLESQPSQHN